MPDLTPHEDEIQWDHPKKRARQLWAAFERIYGAYIDKLPADVRTLLGDKADAKHQEKP